ncbi:MAG: choice-of-anchor Q domain-containing protein, partial [Candidatus Marinimicrobia bacterium]|nr:choice-of-anchor Q domain-containing protein [Candidatus Neomarinimicrobiota bacterium]
ETSHADTIRIMPGTYYESSFNSASFESLSQQSTGKFDLTIVGMNAGTGEVLIDAQKNSRHMVIDGSGHPDMQISYTFKNIHFTNGESRNQDGYSGGGSMVLAKVTAKFVNCHFSNNQATANVEEWSPGGAIHIASSTVKIISCGFEDNFSRTSGGAININWYGENDVVDVEIRNSTFTRNEVQINDGEQITAWGGAISFDGTRNLRLKIEDSIFSENRVRNNNSGKGCYGGAIGSGMQDPNDSWSNIEPVIINRNIFMDNANDCGPGTWAGASVINVGWNIDISNSLFARNYTKSDGVISGFVIRNEPQTLGAEMTMVNNTVVRNQLRNQNGSVITDGSPIAAWGQSEVTIFNNIIWDNQSNQVFWFPDDVTVNEDYNNFDDNSGQQFGANTLSEKPRFVNPDNDNYRLGATSPLINKGTYSFMGHNAPIKDVRGYYRIETPDIGAYEAGASKYILAIADDIVEDEDTTFVNLADTIKVTVTTGDIDGNVVTDSDEAVSWDIFPNQKYARVDTDAETTTSNGTASATIIVTSQTRGKGFRFRVIAYVGEGIKRSDMYVIEELITGAPPPVVDLTISPSTWTSQPDFTMNWETPSWFIDGDKGRELIGAVVEITDGINVYSQYMGFPDLDTLENYSFTAPEAGQYITSLWLMDEFGNEDRDSARSVTAYFDDVLPDEFDLHWPDSSGTTIEYAPDIPEFHWHARGDYPSGIKEWRLFLKKGTTAYAFNYAYTWSDVTTDTDDRHVTHAGTPLSDGYYNWYVEAVDSAENVTISDTAYFGVDLNPPRITHSNPLTQVDENTTSPSINASFDDSPGSGVKYGRLNYRRSGSGGGFVVVDLLAGPVNISGSDIKADGLEYYIDTEDNIGNYGRWPSDTTFHSVRVQTESPVTTASRWPSGVPGGTDSTNYVFFSIPFDVGNAKSAIMSILDPQNEGPDEFKYRLYAYSNGWQENPSSITMGNGYFFIFDPDKYSETPNLSFNFGQGVSTATDPPYQVNVTPGQWKFFGTPYNFNISLSNVYTEDESNINDAGSIYTWNGSWSNAGSSLQPWQGYIFKSGGATKLNIDARGTGFGKMAKAMNTDDYPMDGDEWIIDMIATTGNARDELNSVGVRHMAEDGYDPLDEFEPPTVMGDITLRIDNRDREEAPDLYAKDIRKPNEIGHYWDLQVFAPTNGQRTYLTFEGLGYIPDEYDVFLINKTTKQAKNLEWENSYRFANTGSDSYLRQDLRLVVGTKQFVEDNNAGVNLYPDAFTLAQNYPNPFNPQTSIMISLEEDANVDLIIYNLLGEEITKLAANEYRPAGYYTFIWNGTNHMGVKVSTGMYFYHTMIKDAQGKVVLNKTKKMIFLK